jgi:hypothetical protein
MEYPKTSSGVPTEGRNVSENTPPPTPAPHLTQVEVDDSTTTSNYANFCRLSGTPEELLIDFGLNSQPASLTPQPVAVSQRIVTGWHTAKRLLHALQLTVDRHEAAFGVLETDVRKRIGRK